MKKCLILLIFLLVLSNSFCYHINGFRYFNHKNSTYFFPKNSSGVGAMINSTDVFFFTNNPEINDTLSNYSFDNKNIVYEEPGFNESDAFPYILSLIIILFPSLLLGLRWNGLKYEKWLAFFSGFAAGFIVMIVTDSFSFILEFFKDFFAFLFFYSLSVGFFEEVWRFLFMKTFTQSKNYKYSFGLGWGFNYLLFNGFMNILNAFSFFKIPFHTPFVLNHIFSANSFLMLNIFFTYFVYRSIKDKKNIFLYLSIIVHLLVIFVNNFLLHILNINTVLILLIGVFGVFEVFKTVRGVKK